MEREPKAAYVRDPASGGYAAHLAAYHVRTPIRAQTHTLLLIHTVRPTRKPAYALCVGYDYRSPGRRREDPQASWGYAGRRKHTA